MPAVNGVPSVTEVLEAVGLRQSYRYLTHEQRERSRNRGKGMHKIIELYHRGRLDVETVHPELQDPFGAYLEFVEEVGHVPMFSELELVHEPFQVSGHIDRVGTVWGKLAVIDWTLSDSPDLPGKLYQVAGYRMLWDHANPELPSAAGYVLSLGKTGRKKLYEQGDHEAQVFTAAVIVHRAQKGVR